MGWVLSGTPPRFQAVSRDCRVAEGSLKLQHSRASALQALRGQPAPSAKRQATCNSLLCHGA